jgi:hypothetical protein
MLAPSPGNPSLRAFIQDALDIRDDLGKRGYERVLAYGTSLGGIVLVNAVSQGMLVDKLIMDSIPSDLSNYDCDTDLYPFNVVDKACPAVVALSSENDHEVRPAEQLQLLNRISSKSCGGKVVSLHIAIHAFNDKPGDAGDSERLHAVQDALALP